MKRIILTILFFLLVNTVSVYAQSTAYTVQPGDSMWKIAVRYEIGLSELAQANPQVKNIALIYPGQKIAIPNIDSIKGLETEVVRLVNVERSKRGLHLLKQNWELSRVARYKSQDMINKGYFGHESPTYGSPFKMMESFGIKCSAAAENIACGQKAPQEVMSSWMNSTGHRNNILGPSFLEIGVGAAKDSQGNIYWTQMFIKPL
ncbi:MAG: SafA/ExsA family spore coat assembly protein [Peptococcaceae bacterium]|nr:SafA/ExsA family spore coat assembly protein [Peptococcaceae bacterium]